MRVQSLACQTDLNLTQFDGQIIDRGHYLVVVTPSNPTYFWGNYLLFDDPPSTRDFARWQSLFAAEIGNRPGIVHRAFGWDASDGRLGHAEPFLAAGFRLLQSTVLAANQVHQPPHYDPEIAVRPLSGETDWRHVGQYHDISPTRLARFRSQIEAGLGTWFGAFINDQPAADLGLFVKDGIGRFQEVETYPNFRRRGVCRSLVYRASRYAFDHVAAKKLVIVADEGSAAESVYQQVGFQAVERQVGIDDLPLL